MSDWSLFIVYTHTLHCYMIFKVYKTPSDSKNHILTIAQLKQKYIKYTQYTYNNWYIQIQQIL